MSADIRDLLAERDLLRAALARFVAIQESTALDYTERDWIEARRLLAGAPSADTLIADRDRYGRALDNISATANRLFSHLHGGKCDGPRNKTEVVLLDISAAATAALNGTANPRTCR